MKKLSFLLGGILLGFGATKSYAQVDISGTPYTNLTYAFAAINAGTHTGNVVVNINANCNEGTGIAMLNANGVGGASYSSVTIRAMADNLVVEGSDVTVIHLKGADNVTINGNNLNSTAAQQDLTIRNTSAGGGNTCIWVTSAAGTAGAATNNNIRNCIIEGVDKVETYYGILVGGNGSIGAAAATPNNNNTIDSNIVRKCRSGIVTVGGNLAQDQGWRIRANRVGSTTIGEELGYEGISCVNAVTISILNNTVAGIYGDIAQVVKGINLGLTINGATIAGNRIHNIGNEYFALDYGAAGLFINSLIATSDNKIYNNEIWNIDCYGVNTGPTYENNSYGIVLAQGGNFDIWHNTIDVNSTNEINDASSAAIFIAAGVAPASITLMNNILINSNTGTTDTAYSVYIAGSLPVFAAVNYNLYYSDGPNLSYLGGQVPDLATWKALTTRDTGSVSALPAMIMSGDDLYVDSNDPTSWYANNRGFPTTIPQHLTDINGLSRNAIPGQTRDIGSREFSTTTIAPDCIASGAPAASTTTTYTSAGRQVAEINWGAGGTLPTSVSVKYYPGMPPIGPPTRIWSHWDMSAPDGSGYDFTLKLLYTEAENNAQPIASLTIIRDSTSSGDWRNSGGSATGSSLEADGFYVDVSNTLNAFTLFSLGNVPLGLDMLEFTAKNNNGVNDLNWMTANERNMTDFDVQRSEDGVNFSTIGNVVCKNEFMGSKYSYRDAAPKAGYNYYRLKMNESAGNSAYSKIVAVKNAEGSTMDITSVYPNPASSVITIGLYSNQDDNMSIEVTDLTGRTVLSAQQAVKAGSQEMKLNVADLATGIYTVKATRADGQVSINKIVKQ